MLLEKYIDKLGARTYRVSEFMNPFISNRMPNWRAKYSVTDGIRKMITFNYRYVNLCGMH